MEKMVKIDDVEISESTVKAALKSAGIKLEKEYIPSVGHMVKTRAGNKRIIITDNGRYAGMDLTGRVVSIYKEKIEDVYPDCSKLGELKDSL